MIIGNPIMAGVSGPAASIFVTGLSETDTVTATNGSKTLTGKWTQKPNPATHGLPDGYTQLEYIESTGTQYINTGLTFDTAAEYTIDFTITGLAENQYGNSAFICGTVYGAYWYLQCINTNAPQLIWASYLNNTIYRFTSTSSLNTEYHAVFKNAASEAITCNDLTFTTSSQSYTQSFNYNMLLFATDHPSLGIDGRAKARIMEFSKTAGNHVAQHFVPARRNSDSVLGMYDIANGVFYTNAGTGTFTAGPEVPQTIGGFLIKPIRELGTWTVTATDGTKTATQDVLVDVITEYEIEISYKTYLYNEGDECEDVTGGWVDKANNSTYGYFKKQSGYLEIGCSSSAYYYDMGVSKNIDISGYTKAYVDLQFFSGSYSLESYSRGMFRIGGKSTGFSYGSHSGSDHQNLSTNRTVLELDISSATETHLSTQSIVNLGANGQIKVYRIWLE